MMLTNPKDRFQFSAKGDDSRSRNQIDYQGGLAQNHLNNLRNDMIIPQAQQAWNDYAGARDRSLTDYSNLQTGYQDLGNQFRDWSKTGGFSPQDISNIRSRSLSPLRSVYSNANREVDRQRSLQGGYSPGYGVLKARMAREMGQGMSDASINTEASLAELINSGKRFGMQGQNQALEGQRGLFSQIPGQASFYGGMQNQAMNNWLQSQGLQNQLGLGLINSQINASQIPGKYENTMGRVRDIADIGSRIWSQF